MWVLQSQLEFENLNIILYGDHCIIDKVMFNGGDKLETSQIHR